MLVRQDVTSIGVSVGKIFLRSAARGGYVQRMNRIPIYKLALVGAGMALGLWVIGVSRRLFD